MLNKLKEHTRKHAPQVQRVTTYAGLITAALAHISDAHAGHICFSTEQGGLYLLIFSAMYELAMRTTKQE